MKRYLPQVALLLFALQVLLMLVSWLWSAAFPMSGVHSLLSEEGIRWFMGHFADFLAKPQLVWVILLGLAYGTLVPCVRSHHQLKSYRERWALLMTVALLVVFLVAIAMLTLIPHAILLSATGSLWPSPFSSSLVPLVAFMTITLSAFYGFVAGRFAHLHDLYQALLDGVRDAAPLLLFYILLVQLWESLRYVIS